MEAEIGHMVGGGAAAAPSRKAPGGRWHRRSCSSQRYGGAPRCSRSILLAAAPGDMEALRGHPRRLLPIRISGGGGVEIASPLGQWSLVTGGANDEEDVVTSDTSRSPRHGGRGSSGGGLVQVLVKRGADYRGSTASAERPGAVASTERRGVVSELLEVGGGRRGSSRLLEAPPSLLIERTRSAGGGTGSPSTPTSTNSSPAPALDGAPLSGRVSDFVFDLRTSFKKNSICKGVFAKHPIHRGHVK